MLFGINYETNCSPLLFLQILSTVISGKMRNIGTNHGNDFRYEQNYKVSQSPNFALFISVINGSRCKTYQKGKLPLLFDDADEHNGEI